MATSMPQLHPPSSPPRGPERHRNRGVAVEGGGGGNSVTLTKLFETQLRGSPEGVNVLDGLLNRVYNALTEAMEKRRGFVSSKRWKMQDCIQVSFRRNLDGFHRYILRPYTQVAYRLARGATHVDEGCTLAYFVKVRHPSSPKNRNQTKHSPPSPPPPCAGTNPKELHIPCDRLW